MKKAAAKDATRPGAADAMLRELAGARDQQAGHPRSGGAPLQDQ